jgi:hypothetical protein
MQGGPDGRSPDYYSFTVTGPWAGLNLVHDANGNNYWGPVLAPPGAGWKIGASATAGYLDPGDGTGGVFLHGRKPNPDQIYNFVSGWGAQVCGGAILVYCRTWSKGAGYANEFGVGTPQFGASGGDTWNKEKTQELINNLNKIEEWRQRHDRQLRWPF